MDKITEAIAHFIGLFHIAVEDARLRQDFEEFEALRAQAKEQPDLTAATVNPRAPHELAGFDPGLRYYPLPPELVWETPWSHAGFVPPYIPDSLGELPIYPGFVLAGQNAGISSGRLVAELEPPGSIAVRIHQESRVLDNDYVGVGGSGLRFNPEADFGAKMAALLNDAARFSPLGDLEAPGSAEAISDIILSAPSALTAFAAEHQANENVSVFSARSIEGSFVNGRTVAAAPELKDHLPNQPGEQADEPGSGKPPKGEVKGQGELLIEPSVTLEAGGNTLVNSASLTNTWVGAGVTAVLGDHVSLNAIVQTNVWSDNDLVGASLNGWKFDPLNATKAFNIAAFQHIDPSADGGADGQAVGAFPKGWAVSEIQGDLIMLNWIEQLNFVMDNDIHMLASSGVTTMVTTGANAAVNGVSLAELGLYYDLIVVGGNFYDANLIQQLNVLLDDDLVGSVNGFQTTGKASLSTSGNLLWNQAEIANVGSPNNVEAMPAHFREMVEAFKAGGKSISDEVLKDSAFFGLDGIRVLSISGSAYNLNYVKQTNVLGDADQVALAMEQAGGHPGADWAISTGKNALVNVAGIVDYDFAAKAYVGNQHYSDEILIQAEFVSMDPNLGGRDPDTLVNEAVAFLDDDMARPEKDVLPGIQQDIDAPHLDIMQSVLA
jgi:hypothetical protein